MACENSTDWQTAARSYLDRLGLAEYREQRAAWLKRRRSAKTFRYSPTDYHLTLCYLLGQNDEEGFKAFKLETGYASSLKC